MKQDSEQQIRMGETLSMEENHCLYRNTKKKDEGKVRSEIFSPRGEKTSWNKNKNRTALEMTLIVYSCL